MIIQDNKCGGTESERFAEATLDALSEHVAVLDMGGTIVFVNRAWREFAAANSSHQKGLAEGANYLDVCDHATSGSDGDARRFAEGLRSVINGFAAEFSLEYPCHSPNQQRWYIARVTRFELEGEVRTVVTHLNISARKLTEEALRFRSKLLDTVEQAVIATDVNGTIIYWNRFAEKLYGWPAAEITGQNIIKVAPSEARERASEIISLLSSGQSWLGEFTVRRRDGTTFPAFITDTPIYDDEGALAGIVGVSSDITERKMAEEELRRKEERFRVLFELGPVAVFACDSSGVIQDYNRRAAELWGREPKRGDSNERYCGSFKLYHPDGRRLPHAESPIVRVLGTGSNVQGVEVLIERPGGSRIPVIVNFSPQRDERGEVVGAITSFLDISDRKAAEEALRESQEQYRSIVNQVLIGVTHSDLSGRLTLVNQKYCEITGYSESELLDMRIQDLTHPDDLTFNLELFEKLITEGTPFEIEKRYQRKDGSIIWVHVGASAIRNSEGKPESAVAVVVDTTERKRVANLFDAQKQSLEMVVSGAPLTEVLSYLTRIVEEQAEGQAVASVLLLDDQGYLHTGASPSLPEDYTKAIDGLRPDPNVGTCSAAAASGTTVITPDIAADPKWQSLKHLPLALGLRAAWSVPILARDGRILGTFGTYFRECRTPQRLERQAVEILARTAALAIERKLAEQRLMQSEEHLRAIFEASRDGILVEQDEHVVYVNNSYARLLGYERPKDLIGIHVSLLMSPDDAGRMLEYGKRRLRGESPPTAYEFKGRRRDGALLDLEASVSTHTSGGATFITTSIRDIAERKRAEEALRQSERKYRLLMEQASDGIHTYDSSGNFIETNSKLCEMLGYTREEMLRLNVKDLIEPEELIVAPIRFDRLREGQTLLTERQLLRKDGTLLPVEIGGKMVQDGVLQSIIRDITDRKRAEAALRQAYDELETRVEERTAEIAAANEMLKAEMVERLRAEQARQELLRRLVLAQEDERRRISRELHDQMGQQLTALMMGLKALDGASHGRASTIASLQQLQQLTDQLTREVHSLAWELRPPALDDLGLETALYNYAEEWAERSRVVVDFHSSGFETERLPVAHETTIYRIAQEALTNVFKHSMADRVSFILERRGDHVLAVVEDNGQGFDVQALQEKSTEERNLGLLGMRERASLLGGTLAIESEPGIGTSVFVRIPLEDGRRRGVRA